MIIIFLETLNSDKYMGNETKYEFENEFKGNVSNCDNFKIRRESKQWKERRKYIQNDN